MHESEGHAPSRTPSISRWVRATTFVSPVKLSTSAVTGPVWRMRFRALSTSGKLTSPSPIGLHAVRPLCVNDYGPDGSVQVDDEALPDRRVERIALEFPQQVGELADVVVHVRGTQDEHAEIGSFERIGVRPRIDGRQA